MISTLIKDKILSGMNFVLKTLVSNIFFGAYSKTDETLIPLLSFCKRRIRALGKQLKHAAAAKAAGIGHS